MNIERYPGNAPGRSRAVAYQDLVFAVATAASAGPSVREQTKQALAKIDDSLLEAGSDKTRLLSATVYLTAISHKAEMDEVWNEWIGPEHWPQRACVAVGLSPDTLVEIVVTAARK
ncbi:MAG: RidA family protein [Gemmataceae bacterium]